MTYTGKLALVAILSAVSFLLMLFQFPLIPGVDFLLIDFSIIPVLLGLVLMDLGNAMSVLFLRSLLYFFLSNNGISTLIGLPMNVVALACFVVSFAFIWKREVRLSRYLLASVTGSLGMTLVMLCLNYVYAIPLYARFAHFDIEQLLGVGSYLLAMVLPFNLLQGCLFAVVFYGVYYLLSPLLQLKKI